PLRGDIVVANLALAEDDRSRIIDGVSFTVPLDEHIAIIGQSGSGKNELALLLARLMRPTGGGIRIGGMDLAELPVAVIGRRIGYVGPTPYLFSGTLRENLLLGLRHRPIQPAEYDDDEARRRARQLMEARRSGNIEFDLHADWIDYAAAGVADPDGCPAGSPRCLRGSISGRISTPSVCAGASIPRSVPTWPSGCWKRAMR